jgi:hypothetical protein
LYRPAYVQFKIAYVSVPVGSLNYRYESKTKAKAIMAQKQTIEGDYVNDSQTTINIAGKEQ